MFSTFWLTVIFALVGAAVGSFLNVCICRIPEGLSIVFPPSRCPHCGHPIRFYDNIPLVSYLLLGGKCRDCREKISPRYPLVEFITAIFAGLLFWKYGLTPAYPVMFLFVCTLIVITFIDLDHQIIPHILTLSGIPIFAVLAVVFMGLTLIDAFLGIMIGAGTLYFVAVYYEALTGREGMGGGRCKPSRHVGGISGLEGPSVHSPRQFAARCGCRGCACRGEGQGYAVCGSLRSLSLRRGCSPPLLRGIAERTFLFPPGIARGGNPVLPLPPM